MLVRYMDSTCKSTPFSSWLLVSDDFTKANHNLPFALKLVEALYDQSWGRISISLLLPGSLSGRDAYLTYSRTSVDDGGPISLDFSYLRTTELT